MDLAFAFGGPGRVRCGFFLVIGNCAVAEDQVAPVEETFAFG